MTRAVSPFLRRAIAFHESAHAVVGRHLGLAIENATIIPGPGFLGKVCFRPCGDAVGSWQCVLAHGISAAAGPIAQRRAAPWSSVESASATDIAFGQFCGLVIASSEASREALTAFFEEEAEALMDTHWWAIERFAAALLEHGTLEGDSLDKAFEPIDDMQRRIDEGIRQARAAAASEGMAA